MLGEWPWHRVPRDDGPCYDLCSCAHCWNGWKGVPFRRRLRWRLHYILHRGYR